MAILRQRLTETIFKIEKELSMKGPQSSTFFLYLFFLDLLLRNFITTEINYD